MAEPGCSSGGKSRDRSWGRALTSALTIAVTYAVGGIIPLAPYLGYAPGSPRPQVSVKVTTVALAVFGYVKRHFARTRPVRSAMQTVLIGGVAAEAAFGMARSIS